MALVPFRERDYLFPNHQNFWDVVHFLGLVRDFGYRDEDELNRSAKKSSGNSHRMVLLERYHRLTPS